MTNRIKLLENRLMEAIDFEKGLVLSINNDWNGFEVCVTILNQHSTKFQWIYCFVVVRAMSEYFSLSFQSCTVRLKFQQRMALFNWFLSFTESIVNNMLFISTRFQYKKFYFTFLIVFSEHLTTNQSKYEQKPKKN